MPRPTNMSPVKAKNAKKSLIDLLKYCKGYILVLVIAAILTIVSTASAVYSPILVGNLSNLIKDGIEGSFNMDEIVTTFEILIIIYVSSSILTYFVDFIMATITAKISKKLRHDISIKINRLPLSFYDKTTYGDILSRITNDVDTISQTLNMTLSSFIASVTTILGCIVMMFISSYILAFTTLGSTFVGFIIVGIIMSKSQKYFISRQRSLGSLNGHIEEVYSGHTIVKVYSGEKISKEKFDRLNNEVKINDQKSQFFSGLMQPLMGFVGNFGFVLVAIVGTILAINGNITFGIIVTFIIYVRRISHPLSQVAQSLTSLQSTAAASERVFEFLNAKELSDESNKTKVLDAKNIVGNVEFKNVHFGYNSDKTIINDFSIKIKPGSKVAIVGPTGAGKTTIVNLLMNFYELNSGNIFIDGINTKDLTRDNIHNLFGMVLQDTWLFEGTIKENLKFNNKDVTDEEIFEACKACGLDHFIKSLPHSYDTVLNDVTTISAGQKQLLTITRAMIQNSPMLILDEATSNVDTRTEVLIQKAMDKLTKGRTSFVIAHRLSTIKNADIILVMNDGDIVETGNHKELLAKDGFYAKLYNSQFEN